MKTDLQLVNEEKSPHSSVTVTLEKLLSLWSDKQPIRCYRFGSNWVVRGFGASRVIENPASWADFAQLEYIIRGAIAELNWTWGKIVVPETMLVVRNGKGPKLYCQLIEECGGNTAIALLAAFLKALGAEV